MLSPTLVELNRDAFVADEERRSAGEVHFSFASGSIQHVRYASEARRTRPQIVG